jgi:hypothetical protein
MKIARDIQKTSELLINANRSLDYFEQKVMSRKTLGNTKECLLESILQGMEDSMEDDKGKKAKFEAFYNKVATWLEHKIGTTPDIYLSTRVDSEEPIKQLTEFLNAIGISAYYSHEENMGEVRTGEITFSAKIDDIIAPLSLADGLSLENSIHEFAILNEMGIQMKLLKLRTEKYSLEHEKARLERKMNDLERMEDEASTAQTDFKLARENLGEQELIAYEINVKSIHDAIKRAVDSIKTGDTPTTFISIDVERMQEGVAYCLELMLKSNRLSPKREGHKIIFRLPNLPPF